MEQKLSLNKHYLLGRSTNSSFLDSSNFLHSVLAFLALFSGCLFLFIKTMLKKNNIVCRVKHCTTPLCQHCLLVLEVVKWFKKKKKGVAYPLQPVFGLIFLGVVQWVVNHAKSCCLATTKLSFEAEDEHHIWGGLVHFCKLFPDLYFRDCCSAWMQDIDNLNEQKHEWANAC